MVLVQYWPYFRLFILGNRGQENVFYDILEGKNASLRNKNKKFKKSQKWDVSKGISPWFWLKIGNFSIFFILGNVGQENVVYDILEGKNTFLGNKTRSSKSKKIEIFPKGFGSKFEFVL